MSTDIGEWELNHEDNPHITKNSKTDEFKCDTCKIGIKSKGGATKHLHSEHNVNVDGSIFKEDEELKKEETIESHSLFNNNNEFNSEYPKETLDDVVMRINTSDDAKSAGKIVKDIELMYLYYMLKQKKIVHPEWTLHDFLRETAYFWAEAYGVNASFSQDLRSLNNNQRQVMELVRQRWEEVGIEE